MKNQFVKRIFALTAALSLCFALAGCGGETPAASGEDSTSDTTVYAAAGGSIAIPEGLVATEGTNVLNTALADGTMAGLLSLVSYRTTGYFTTGGSIIVNVNATLSTSDGEAVKTKYTDTNMTLWKQGSGNTEFVGTVHFAADGSTQTYTFDNLEPGASYRVAFTYSTIAKYRLNGSFNITGISGEGSAEETVAAE